MSTRYFLTEAWKVILTDLSKRDTTSFECCTFILATSPWSHMTTTAASLQQGLPWSHVTPQWRASAGRWKRLLSDCFTITSTPTVPALLYMISLLGNSTNIIFINLTIVQLILRLLSPLKNVPQLCPSCAQTSFSLVCPEIAPRLCLNCFCLDCASTVPQVTLCLNFASAVPRLCPNCAREFSSLCPNCASTAPQPCPNCA